MNDSSSTVTWYVARNHLGEFCRRSQWVRSLNDAHLYRNPGPAKSAITKWAKKHPTLPVPELLEWRVDLSTAKVIDMTERTGKAVARIQKRGELRLENEKRWRRESLERELARKTEELRALSR